MDTQITQVEKDHSVDTERPVQREAGYKPMTEMISLRTFLLSTKTGHMIRFKAGEPKMVPSDAVPEALEKGCVPTDSSDLPFFENLQRSKAEFAGDLRRSIILAAIGVLVEDNNSKNFDGGGLPKPEVLSDRVGFDVTKVERQSLFQEFMGAQKAGIKLDLHPDTEVVRMIVSAETRKELMSVLPNTKIKVEQTKGLQMTELRKLLLSSYAMAQR